MTFVPALPTEGGLTLAHWARLGDPYLYARVLPNTAVVGLGAVLVSLAFATPMAWLLNRTSLPLGRVFITLVALVAIVPGFVKAMGWLLLFHGRIGLGNRFLVETFGFRGPLLDISAGPYGMAWIVGLSLAPTMFFLMAGPLQALDPALEEAALMSGASRWQTVWRISLPLVWPATLGGAIYTFMTAVSIFEIPALVSGTGGQTPVLATELFYAVNPATATSGPSYGAAGVCAALIAILSLLALYFYLRVLAQGRRYETIKGRGYHPQRIDLGRLAWPAAGFVVLYLLLAVFLPLLVLVWTSLLPVLRVPSTYALTLLTLDNYVALGTLIGDWEMIRNTIVLVVSVALAVVVFSFAISWIVVRTRYRFRRALDVVAMLPHAIPGLAFAFALAMVAILFSRWAPAIPLKGTIGIIIFANLINRLAYGTRITNAALVQVSPELEESAWLSGARPTTTMWRVVAPLVKPSLLYAGLWTAILPFREVSMALMLQEPGNVVLATKIWLMWRSGYSGEAAAAAVLMIAILGVLVLLAQWIVGDAFGDRREAPRHV